MPLLIILIFFTSSFSFTQTDSFDCSALHTKLNNQEHMLVEEQVSPVGGLEAIQRQLVYPNEALKNNIEGKVYVLVIVDSTGTLLCPKILKRIGYGCDEEALRIITNTKFNPTVFRGKPITTKVTIPITFILPN